ncbi:MAG: amidohydrolase family protein [Rhizobiales bacterium]|nr:amidohydrolase family protein [Hyphomicrobiales bacterium]
MAREDQLDAMKELDLTPSFFSLHIYYWGDRHRDIFIGPERAARISPAGSAVRRGMRFTIHCDTPVVPMTPLKLMACAIGRKTTSGQVLGPDQRIDIETALRTHTVDAAWQMRVDHLMGSIEPGKLADFVIFDREPSAENLETVQIDATILGDRLIYDRAGHAPSA